MSDFEYLEGKVPGIPCATAVKTKTHVYISGTAVFQDESGHPITDVRIQTEKCLKEIEKVLSNWKLDRRDIAMMTVFVKGKENFGGMNEAYKEFFGEIYPARTACITELGHPDMLVEISGVACF